MNERKTRGTTQKIYLIEQKNISEYVREFAVMGSTGNLYTVSIKTIPSCTCPDFTKRNKKCKHIYFILMRIMGINEQYVDEEQYTNYKLKKMFSVKNVIDNTAIANTAIKKKYENVLTGSGEIQMKPLDDMCPVCLDELDNGEPVIHCKYSCGKPIHETCFKMWCKVKDKNCLNCGAKWDTKSKNSDYINLK